MQVVSIPIDTDPDGNGWRQTDQPFAKFIAVAHEGSDPGVDGKYWTGSAHVQDRNGDVLVSVTGATPSAQTTVLLTVAT